MTSTASLGLSISEEQAALYLAEKDARLNKMWWRGLLGWGLGLAAGSTVGLALDSPADEAMFPGPTAGMLVGGLAGASIGASFGVHRANEQRGDLLLATLLPAGAQALLTLLSYVTMNGSGVMLAVLVAPLIQIGLSVSVEQRTARP